MERMGMGTKKTRAEYRKEIEDVYNGISDATSMLEFLRARAEGHAWIHHYTTACNFAKMFTNRCAWLSRLDATGLNDRHEYLKKGKRDLVKRTYIWCFMQGGLTYENAALWALYGNKSPQAVRLSVPKAGMKKLIQSLSRSDCKIYPVIRRPDGSEVKSKIPLKNSKFKVEFSDIVYVGDDCDGPKAYTWETLYNSKGVLKDLDKSDELTGFVKHFGWKNEREVRLHIQFEEELKDESGEVERIAVELPATFFEKSRLTLSPWLFDWTAKEVAMNVSSLPTIGLSQFTGLLNFQK